MSKNSKLIKIVLGIPEFGFSLLFSISIWLELLHNVIIPSLIFFSLLIIALFVTIWQMFNRKKATAYLIAFATRMGYLALTLAICQIGGLFNYDSLKTYWLIFILGIYIFGIILHFNLEKKYWQHTLNDWETTGKMNVEKRLFKICKAFHSHPPTPENFKKIFIIIPAGTILLTILMKMFGSDIKTIFLHFSLFYLGYFCIFMVGRILAWIDEIKKLEKELEITIVTEYGMVREKAKLQKD